MDPPSSEIDAAAAGQAMRSFVVGVLHSPLGGVAPDVASAALDVPASAASIGRFASDPQVSVCCIAVEPQSTDGDDEEEDGTSTAPSSAGAASASIHVDTSIAYRGLRTRMIVVMKRAAVAIDPSKSIASQVSVLDLSGEGSPFETIHSVVHKALTPLFDAYVHATHRDDADKGSKIGIPTVKGKLADLELSLLHLQQNIDIPEVLFDIHPHIAQVIEQCKAKGTRPKLADLGAIVEEDRFLGFLQAGVKKWIREIQKVTNLDRDPSSGSAMQEIRFWVNMERALLNIQSALDSDGVLLTLQALKHAKRFFATTGFESDTSLKQALDRAHNYNVLMNDFPLNELLAAPDLDHLTSALSDIFTHLKKLRATTYPAQRALYLLEAVSRDVTSQLIKILAGRRLAHTTYDEFERATHSCFNVFAAWEDNFMDFRNMVRDIVHKRDASQRKLAIRVTPTHGLLQERLSQLRAFRKHHEQLIVVIKRVQQNASSSVTPSAALASSSSPAAEIDSMEAISRAFQVVQAVDVLDVSPAGIEAWVAARQLYDERIDRVETHITAHLRDQLGTAKNAQEMFRIFARFNALLVRPRIRGATQEYQSKLIQRVKDDIRALHDKFKVQYPSSMASRMSQLRDLPPVSGEIIWVRQIERQLATYTRRVEDVLGKGWENHVEGKPLFSDITNFRRMLDTQALFDAWAAAVENRNVEVKGPIFLIKSVRVRAADGSVSTQRRLVVNFDEQLITLFKEVRNLQAHGLKVPFQISSNSNKAKEMYPSAITLLEALKTYDQTRERIARASDVAQLVASYHRDIRKLISEGMPHHWEFNHRKEYVRRLAEAVLVFQEKVDEIQQFLEAVEKSLAELSSCAYTSDAFRAPLVVIQKSVDELNLRGYSNLTAWVRQLDARVESQLIARLVHALELWITDFTSGPVRRPLLHEIRIRNQVLSMEPPLEHARASMLGQLHEWLGVVCSLTRVRTDVLTTDDGDDLDTMDSATYRSALNGLSLAPAYEVIEQRLAEVGAYVHEWLQYQSLWDMQPEMVYARLGEDVATWKQLLVEIKQARATFDNSEIRRSFGPVIVDYRQVQSKVNLKYDSWHKEILSRFGSLLGDRMHIFFDEIARARSELESRSVTTESTVEAVSFITYVGELKRKSLAWSDNVLVFREGQKVLERQRYQFPSDWLHCDQVDGEWSAFSEILKRKDTVIDSQKASLQGKIINEDRAVSVKITEVLTDWEQNKPVQGDTRPDTAANTLQIYEGRLQRAQQDHDRLLQAKRALDLDASAEDRLVPALEELHDLKGVWSEMARVWTALDDLRDRPWAAIVPRKIRQSLEELVTQMRALPNRMRSYAAYDHVNGVIKGYLKTNSLLIDLKSDGLKERHWKMLMKKLHVSWSLHNINLGLLWDANLMQHERVVRDVINVAQGEMALEEFLRQVREFWQQYELDLVNYQNKCRLIRGWDDLFDKVKEHLSAVGAMKLSPYFKVFEEEAVAWEDKLNRILSLFDVWIDVQRRWVYLEGIFTGSADIKNLLPVETGRFQNISTEFLGLMKKVSRAPRVLEVLNIQAVQRLLERLSDLLAKIQKALGEYLERQRATFPRFYFLGDEDLLEIIGNSKDISKLQKHFRKMFAGVNSITLSDDGEKVVAVCSREGETVPLHTPVSIKENPKINEWLTRMEKEIQLTLAHLLDAAVQSVSELGGAGKAFDGEAYLRWMDQYPVQIVVLSAQVAWSQMVEPALARDDREAALGADGVSGMLAATLNMLADTVLVHQPPIRRRKLEHLITELVHQRDVVRILQASRVSGPQAFEWLSQMRFYFDPKHADVLKRLEIRMANATFHYGFEYLGITDKLVQTPLTDKCYLTMTQALEERLGGNPFGPAGTGKTESVKALGSQLGVFTLVFCCDETFDFKAMGRIFVGLCQVGAWGCFDEFNRLEERMLSAVSQQVQTIQTALKDAGGRKDVAASEINIELIGKHVRVNPRVGIFITMNPGYSGRSNLPDNLKKLFRSLAMTAPDRPLIAQVMLFSQGFRDAELLAHKIVPFFQLCHEQLSSQSHYDFGLRALKAVLVSAGSIKRERIQELKKRAIESSDTAVAVDENTIAREFSEQEVLIQSITETIVPKLVADDIPLLHSLLADVFPGKKHSPAPLEQLHEQIRRVCKERHLTLGDEWIGKIIQLFQIQTLHHGVMMVGPSGSGKTAAWQVLLEALERVEQVEGVSYVIDPKAVNKDDLYGTLDQTTREWTDGLFTHILRKIIDNVRNESSRRHWIVFDGDVDPEWVESLNSVLDDNKLLTLPNGERLSIPPNVRIMFEVQDLREATLATVSRCGMVWFSDSVVSTEMLLSRYLSRLREIPLDEDEANSLTATATSDADAAGGDGEEGASGAVSETMRVQRQCATVLVPHFTADGLVAKALHFTAKQEHIMDLTALRVLTALFSMLNKSVRNVLAYNQQHADFPMESDRVEQYISKRLVFSLIWSFAGDARLRVREELGEYVRGITTIGLPSDPTTPIVDFEVTLQGDWVPWQSRVPSIKMETHKIQEGDVVVPTVDTVRHEDLLYTWLSEHKPLVLCGPPGSGKTMTLFSSLRALPDLEVVGLNFSSATTPELLLKTLEHYCECRRTPQGVVMAPIQIGRWLVLFCDEINLPDYDAYGTQRVISFLRQMVERGGFWRNSDKVWVTLERVQIVGACNPPTDPGRKPLSERFLRHVPVVMVDYPGRVSLKQIYGTFNSALLRLMPSLSGYAEPLTDAMVDFFTQSQERFTVEMQPHYVYSPRELTRWVRGMYEAIQPLESLSPEAMVRVWAHEALRLFEDRLVYDEERQWTEEAVDRCAEKHFPGIKLREALERPILFSNWLNKEYVSVDREELRDFVRARLRVFYEEEMDVQLVLFNEVLDHVLRIDRVFRQVQGHVLLIGASGAGKTTLSRFVAWMNGLSVFQVKVHNRYTGEDFDEDLRCVLRRAGCKGEKICFVMDESNVMDSSFLERMNTLLANGEVPGLFEGDEFSALMTQCKEGSQREGRMLDSSDELYKWFTMQVMKNLHVVFTMNPSTDGLKDRAATSPALFNRCVLDWFGDWSTHALFQVASEFTMRCDLEEARYSPPAQMPLAYEGLALPPTHRDAILNALVYVHGTVREAAARLFKRRGRATHVTPRHYLDFINHFVALFSEKRAELEEQQLHLNVGLQKIRDTVEQVEELQQSLASKNIELESKNQAANLKLKQMVADQQEAERKKAASLEISATLKVQQVEIEEKRTNVMADLAKVEPAVEDARNAVQGIQKGHLAELRKMAQPPALVRLALEAVCALLGARSLDWKGIRQFIVRDDFIASIVNFDSESLSAEMREMMKRDFFSKPDFTFEKVNYSSHACGPMVKWAIAQVEYADMLKRVDPLRNELKALEDTAEASVRQQGELDQLIGELEESIGRYKDEYAVLIADAQSIKTAMSSVKSKVDRSIALLSSLGGERGRWEGEAEAFKAQMGTIAGDVLVSAAFLAYAGYFDQGYRASLCGRWRAHLQAAAVRYRSDMALGEFLSTADERMEWQSNALPVDDLCTENAIMLQRFNRYPLIIDPSGQATEYILKQFAERKVTRTSFLDTSFRKHLESALRFGTALLVQDVERYDPIMNPVLNRELRRTGGRVLIRIGDQDIDFSRTFNVFLVTRDPTVEFPPDVCSRVTFVNFTVTLGSLQSQCLNQVLRSERPDVDAKRLDLLKLQGEFRLRLRHLEKELLNALNSAKGKILDDDAVITSLETLKSEAADVARKVDETDTVMAEVERVSSAYRTLAVASASAFFALEQMGQVLFLYTYSLRFFLDVFHHVLKGGVDGTALKGLTDYDERLAAITKHFFDELYSRVSRGLLYADRAVFAAVLACIRLRGTPSEIPEKEWTYLMGGSDGVLQAATENTSRVLASVDAAASARLARLCARLPDSFDVTRKHAETESGAWEAFHATQFAETAVPAAAIAGDDEAVRLFRQLLVVQAVRPDRVLASARRFFGAALGEEMMHESEVRGVDLDHVVRLEITCNTPVLLCSVPGYDASGRVDDLALQTHARLESIALGSAEGFGLAETAVGDALRTGSWVLLKNVHLAPQWLGSLEKRLHSATPHADFRLFLTMEISPRVPSNLVRMSRVFVFEPPPGVKANLERTLESLPAARLERAPAERSRVYFMLAWFHAVVQERLRYAPIGWTKRYEFSETDLRGACDTVDTWLDMVAKGRSNVSPEHIPWPALQTLLAQCIYGGRIDNDFDQRLISAFLERFFSAQAFDVDFSLCTGIAAPESTRHAALSKWVDELPSQQTPEWLGLPASAESVLLATQGSVLAAKLLKMQTMDDDEITDGGSGGEGGRAMNEDGRPSWMRNLHKSVTEWQKLVPEVALGLQRTTENIKDPLFRCFDREVRMGSALLATVRDDLSAVAAVCVGTRKQTNHLRELMDALTRGAIPKAWLRYVVPRGLTINQWMADFALRVEQLKRLVASRALAREPVWLAGLFVPEAYITATRQYVAQAHEWSLEELELELCVHVDATKDDPDAFELTGLLLEGAHWADAKVVLSVGAPHALENTRLRWVHGGEGVATARAAKAGALPVYLNSTRANQLFVVYLASDANDSELYMRGVAVLASTMKGAE